MTQWYCYECKKGRCERHAHCEYIDPTGELDAPPLICKLNDAKWVKSAPDSANLVKVTVDDPCHGCLNTDCGDCLP